jgi:hypothetical protein
MSYYLKMVRQNDILYYLINTECHQKERGVPHLGVAHLFPFGDILGLLDEAKCHFDGHF